MRRPLRRGCGAFWKRPLAEDDTRAARLTAAVHRLAAAGVAEASVDARLLLCAAAGIERVALVTAPDEPLGRAASDVFDDYVSRRLAGEPVSRILGRREFWSLDLRITSDVLDPRPDTETLVAAALDHLGARRRDPLRILDLGTGSGAILCALLAECPTAFGWGVDRSAAACRVAQDNFARCDLAARSLVVQGDWAAALVPAGFDLVVSNPPYVATGAIASLDPEVRLHDPRAALDGGTDGLDAYRSIAADLPRLLEPDGAAFLEVGAGQADAVATLLRRVGLRDLGSTQDLAGIERVVGARRIA